MNHLPLTRINWSLTAQTNGLLPAWKGSMLRGAIGWSLQRHMQAAPQPDWPGLLPRSSFIDAVFNPQQAWNNQQAVPPWHLQITNSDEAWSPQQVLDGSFLLCGHWSDWLLGLWQDSFEQAVEHGFGIHAPQFRVTNWQVNAQTWLDSPPHPSALELHTLTPARLQDRGRDCTTLQAGAVARSVLRRYRQLHLQLLGQEPPTTMPYPGYPELSRACDELCTERLATPTFSDIKRWSNRQGRAVTMTGITGAIRISGPTLPELAPILAQAPLLHIGKQPNFGLGMVECAWASEPTNPEMTTPMTAKEYQ